MRVIKFRIGKQPYKVSVIIPAKKFSEAKGIISDLKNQNFTNYEITCVYGKGRIAKAWNKGILHSSGKIILFTESDCRVGKNWIKEMVKAVNKNKGVAFGSEVIATSRMLSMASFGIRKDILKDMKFDEEFIIGEDIDFFERLRIKRYELRRERTPIVFHFKSQAPLKRLKWSFIGGIMRVRHWSKYKNSQLNNFNTIFLFRVFHICEELLAIYGAIIGMVLYLPQIIRKLATKKQKMLKAFVQKSSQPLL